MAFSKYVVHVDARVREALVSPENVAAAAFPSERSAQWNGDGRSVLAERTADDRIAFAFFLAADEFPYDRFVDDLEAPDLETTARKIAEFFNEAEELGDLA
ncbi:MAG: hypothetical protein IAI50_17440 [Candidatus Eremiobacteraeota bacterium]|nr:hypothetical protein [Candidatus Eremiobacteraeota bacterium]